MYIYITFSKNKALSSGTNLPIPEPRNITRAEGTVNVIIPCRSYSSQATPFWKVNGTVYYHSDVPPPFVASKSSREITIPTIDSTLSGTSFQCFIPSSSDSGDDLTSSSIGVLTVIANGHGRNHY